MKRDFFQVVNISVLLYGCTTQTLTKHTEKKLYWTAQNAICYFERILEATTPPKQQLYSHLPPISQTIRVRRPRHVRYCRWTKDERTSDVLLSYVPSVRAGYDTRSISKRSLTCLNSEFSFSSTRCLTKGEELCLPYYLPIAGGRIIGFIAFPSVLVLCEMQSVSSRIWTRVAVFISYDDNHYTTGTSDVLLWTPAYEYNSVSRNAIYPLCSH